MPLWGVGGYTNPQKRKPIERSRLVIHARLIRKLRQLLLKKPLMQALLLELAGLRDLKLLSYLLKDWLAIKLI